MRQSNSQALRVAPAAAARSAASIVLRIADAMRTAAAKPGLAETEQALQLLSDGLRGLDAHVFRRGCCIGGWPVDLVCVEAALVVQVDRPGRDGYGSRLARTLAASGYRVLRLRGGNVLQRPEDALAEIVLNLPAD